MLDDHQIAFTIADVSGKGIPASLFMVISKTILKNAALSGYKSAISVSKLIEHTNHQLCENNEEMMFVTAIFGMLNTKTGVFSYVNAGHNYPLVGRTANGTTKWEYLNDKKKLFALGVMDDISYEENQLTLMPGDVLFLYTDGVTEAMSEDGQLYSNQRLADTLNHVGTPDISSKDLISAIRNDISQHVGTAEQSDDITMMSIRYLSP